MREYMWTRDQLLDELQTMHEYMRPKGTRTEDKFCNRFIRPLGCTRDQYGNWHKTIGTSRVLWSSHTDTVHVREGKQDVIRIDGMLQLPIASRSSCLGADDTAGVFLMRHMILRGVPGHYVFHYGEERGAIGSRALARTSPDWFHDIDAAIAFDRRGYTDVITHQGMRTCSDAFARQVSTLLGMGYEPSDQGIFTDTESYAHLIAECTNLSVGYGGAHTPDECLDTEHVLALLDRVCAIDWSVLVPVRDPHVDDDPWPDDPRYTDYWHSRIYDRHKSVAVSGIDRSARAPVPMDSDCDGDTYLDDDTGVIYVYDGHAKQWRPWNESDDAEMPDEDEDEDEDEDDYLDPSYAAVARQYRQDWRDRRDRRDRARVTETIEARDTRERLALQSLETWFKTIGKHGGRLH